MYRITNLLGVKRYVHLRRSGVGGASCLHHKKAVGSGGPVHQVMQHKGNKFLKILFYLHCKEATDISDNFGLGGVLK